MKRIFTIFCLSLMMATSYSQNIAISENAQWVIHYQIGPGPGTEWYTYFKTGGDTIINSTTYKKLFKMPVWRNGSISFYSVGPMWYAYAFRNDGNNRAYIFPSGDSTEHLWYDFNLSIGDTLSEVDPWYSYSPYFYTDTMKVASIDSVYHCNEYRRRFNFNSMQMPSLVQGMGFTGDLIDFNAEFFEASASVVYFGEIGECPIDFLGVTESIESESKFSIYPNPASDFIYLKLSDGSKDIESITLYDLTGRIIFEWQIDNLEDKITLPQNLPDGNYLLEFISEKESHSQKLQILTNN